MLKIRDLAVEEIPILKDFAPPEWNADISAVFARHFGQPYFNPLAAELDGRVVGCANGLLQGSTGWLGNIIVLPPFRGHGIGRQLTEALVRLFRDKCVDHQVLVATSMGEPVYRKLGFTVSSYYIFFARRDEPSATDGRSEATAFEPHHERALMELDQGATGERRPAFLRRYLEGACVHLDAAGALDGYYLPALGAGLLVASKDQAGLALLSWRLGQPGNVCVVPEQNRVSVDFLLRSGFVETSRAPRMTLGPDVGWRPERVYCRGSGFCG